MSRTAITFRATVAPPASRRGCSALMSLYLGLQDLAFEALSELRYGLDRLMKAAWWDDQETVIEQQVYRDMQTCGCACCRLHLPRLLRADEYDHKERYDGHELTAQRLERGAGYVRASSTQIEAGRVLVLGARGEGKGV